MTGAITFEFVVAVCAVLAAAFAVWRWIEARFKATETKASAEASAAADKAETALKAVDGLRLDMIREYASVTHLKEVEQRLVAALDRLTDKIDERWPATPRRRSKSSE